MYFPESIRVSGLILFVVVAALLDFITFRIQNKWILSGMLFGLGLNTLLKGGAGFFFSLKGALVPICILFALYVYRMLGAGDIKVFSGIGAIMGLKFTLQSMIFSFLLGGVLAFLIMLTQKNLRSRLKYVYEYVKHCLLTLKILPYEQKGEKGKQHFPFAVAIMMGSLAAMLL